jgi:hypothetical protein
MSATTAPAVSTRPDAFLRLAMRADALISGATGVGLLLLAPQVAEVSGTTAAVEYATGAFFVGFGAIVLFLAARPAVRTSGLMLAIGNLLFSVLTVIVVLAGVWPLTTTGIILVLGTGVYTLVMAELQYVGVRRI